MVVTRCSLSPGLMRSGPAGEEVLLNTSPDLFDDRDAVFLGRTGIDGRFIDDHVAFADHLADRAAGRDQRAQVGLLYSSIGVGPVTMIHVAVAEIVQLFGKCHGNGGQFFGSL